MKNVLIIELHKLQDLFVIIFQKLISSFDWQSITTEIIKTIFTAFLGFLTFKIYQGYKNRKDNHLLYVHLIKLKKESKSALDKLKTISDEHIELDILKKEFNLYINNTIYKFYKEVAALSLFICEIPTYGYHGEVVDMELQYADYAYSEISQLEGYIASIEDEDASDTEYLNNLKDQLEY